MRIHILIASFVLVACGGGPRSTPEVMPKVAAEYVALYNEWDKARLLALFPADQPANAKRTRKHFAWLHEQLGACGEPQLMWSTDKRGARWTHACERGALETWFRLDEAGQIVDLSVGAAGVQPPPAVQAAAEAVLASLPWAWDAERPFKHNLNLSDATRLGRCTLAQPWAFGPHQGLFHVRCEHGDARVFAIELDRNNTIARAVMMHASFYKGPPV